MNFIINNIFLIVVVVVSATLLLLPLLQRRGKQLSYYEVTQKMNKEKVFILDIRKEEEYALGHIKGAMNIPEKQLSEKMGRIERFKAEPVVVVCEKGGDSARTTSLLKKAGFKDVSNMEGGMKEWASTGMPVVVDESEKGKKKGKS